MTDTPTDGTEVIEPSSLAETENPAPVEQDQDTPTPVSDDNAASGATDDIPETRRDKRIQQLTSRNSDLVGDRNAAMEFGRLQQDHAKTLQDQLDARTTPDKPAAPVMPTLEAFDYDQDAYNAALQNYNSHQIAEQVKTGIADAMKLNSQTVAASQVETDWQTRVKTFTEDHADFIDVASNPATLISPEMAVVIKALENGPELAYHLGQNPAEADRINSLPSSLQAFELGKLDLSSKPAVAQKQVTKAPDPMSPVSGQQPNLSDANMTIDDYMVEWRERQAAKRKQ